MATRSAPARSAPAAVLAPSSDTSRADAGSDYERLLTRAHATFGLAEARGIEAERLGQVLDSIADRFEACALTAQREGWLDRGALRMVVALDGNGQVVGVTTRLDDPAQGGRVALMCLVAPVKAQNFGAASGTGRRGLALEVLFGPVRTEAP